MPLLSDIIDICHEEAHLNPLKTIVKQEKFLDDCKAYFHSRPSSKHIKQLCYPILTKLWYLKVQNQLRGI